MFYLYLFHKNLKVKNIKLLYKNYLKYKRCIDEMIFNNEMFNVIA